MLSNYVHQVWWIMTCSSSLEDYCIPIKYCLVVACDCCLKEVPVLPQIFFDLDFALYLLIGIYGFFPWEFLVQVNRSMKVGSNDSWEKGTDKMRIDWLDFCLVDWIMMKNSLIVSKLIGGKFKFFCDLGANRENFRMLILKSRKQISGCIDHLQI